METVKFVREQSKSENSIPEETTEERVEDIILSLNRKSSKVGGDKAQSPPA